jgi:hypothetical protein
MGRRGLVVALAALMVMGAVVSCGGAALGPAPAGEASTPVSGLPNPASVHCQENGGRLELRQDAAGGVAGVCVFADGSACDEWAFYRGECAPGEGATAADGWAVYESESMGYRFEYPADAAIEPNDDPLQGISIVGPLTDGERWPMIGISHPEDREDYRPPEGADLAGWLVEHNLLAAEGQAGAEVRQADTTIAGTVAVHTRFERSPQSYAYDRYYFARAGQLYMIVIGHTGDREDWALYGRFLESVAFEE